MFRHEELMKLGGTYNKLWMTQQRSEQSPVGVHGSGHGEPAIKGSTVLTNSIPSADKNLTVSADISRDSDDVDRGKTDTDISLLSKQYSNKKNNQDPAQVDLTLIDDPSLVDRAFVSATVEDDVGMRMAAMLADVPMADESSESGREDNEDEVQPERKRLIGSGQHDEQHSLEARTDGWNRRARDHVVDVNLPAHAAN